MTSLRMWAHVSTPCTLWYFSICLALQLPSVRELHNVFPARDFHAAKTNRANSGLRFSSSRCKMQNRFTTRLYIWSAHSAYVSALIILVATHQTTEFFLNLQGLSWEICVSWGFIVNTWHLKQRIVAEDAGSWWSWWSWFIEIYCIQQ